MSSSSSSTQFSQEWARRKVVVKHSIKSNTFYPAWTFFWLRLLLCEKPEGHFRRVYWSVPFVCLSVCLCLSHLLQTTVLHLSRLSSYSRFGIPSYRSKTFFVKIGQRSRSPKNMKTTFWVITFESDVVETSGWSENVPYRKPHSVRGLRFYVRRTVLASRDVKENITMFSLFLICFWKYSHISKTQP